MDDFLPDFFIRHGEDLPAETLNPVIGNCTVQQTIAVRQPATNAVEDQKVLLIREDRRRAYKEIKHPIPGVPRTIILSHGAETWGCIVFCHPLERSNEEQEIFVERSEEIVAVKTLRKRVFEPLLAANNPTRENPYREIDLLQRLANETFILKLIEALQNKKYLFIITPFCEGGDLTRDDLREIPLQIPPVAFRTPEDQRRIEAQARIEYRQMLDCINFIHGEPHRICHADIKPQNFLRTGNRVLLADFGASFKMPNSDLVNCFGPFGTEGFVPPEAVLGLPFNTKQCDLWACTLSLFGMLRGGPLYHTPFVTDFSYAYFIENEGLSENEAMQHRRNQVFAECTQEQREIIFAHLNLLWSVSPELRTLFVNVLAINPGNRWTIENVFSSAWMNS